LHGWYIFTFIVYCFVNAKPRVEAALREIDAPSEGRSNDGALEDDGPLDDEHVVAEKVRKAVWRCCGSLQDTKETPDKLRAALHVAKGAHRGGKAYVPDEQHLLMKYRGVQALSIRIRHGHERSGPIRARYHQGTGEAWFSAIAVFQGVRACICC
jgi:hypothetical protein